MDAQQPSSSTFPPPTQNPKTRVPSSPLKEERDFLNHLESYLARRDGVDKLLKITRYASKILLASSALPETLPLRRRLKSFESSVGLSRKAFRLGKFVQDVNALRASPGPHPGLLRLLLFLIAYGGEGSYYFVEQFVWLAKSGLVDPRHSPNLQKISAWAELVGYAGSITLKLMDLRKIDGDIEAAISLPDSDEGSESNTRALRQLRQKRLLRRLSVVQDLADGLMALADVLAAEKGRLLSDPFLLSCAGLLSALISTHKNWVSC